MAKIGRNQPCPCGRVKSNGSRIKYKYCCAGVNESSQVASTKSFGKTVLEQLKQYEASEFIRKRQQGLGKPIIGDGNGEHQLIAVKNKLYLGKGKVFPDFLQFYIRDVLGAEWENAELSKPLENRHPIMQWYAVYCAQKSMHMSEEKKVYSLPNTGVMACYMMLAYNLYLISHNVELENRLVNRLKNIENFQGAYYELMVASILIRAGFTLDLIDESNRGSKNCEFTAKSMSTGKTYWIEAKMKAVTGLLGKTEISGSKDPNPLSKLIKHLSKAMAKPATNERMIFIDLNADITVEDTHDFILPAIKSMKRYSETNMPPGEKAYIFLTSPTFHRHLNADAEFFGMAYGLGIPDFDLNRPMSISERYRWEKRHADAMSVMDSFNRYLVIPTTFDGSMSSEKLGLQNSVGVGSAYAFDGPHGRVYGTVISVRFSEADKKTFIKIATPSSQIIVHEIEMTEDQLNDYRNQKMSYPGGIERGSRDSNSPMDLLHSLLDGFKDIPRQDILDWLGDNRDKKALGAMSDEDLLIEYCGAIVESVRSKDNE